MSPDRPRAARTLARPSFVTIAGPDHQWPGAPDSRIDLDEALKVLSPAERLCVAMCFGADLSHGEAAEAVVARIEEALRRPFLTGGTEVYTSASIGISLFPSHAEDGPTLLRYADAAMYSSKRASPGSHHVFVNEMADSATKLSFTTRLRKAVEQAEWVLRYQPIVDLSDGALLGVEATPYGLT